MKFYLMTFQKQELKRLEKMVKDFLIIEDNLLLKNIRVIARATSKEQADELLRIYKQQGFTDIFIYGVLK